MSATRRAPAVRRPSASGVPEVVVRRRERPRWASVSAAVTVPAVLAALAVIYPGAPVSQVDLHDGAVWLTNTSSSKLGRYNPRIDELNAGLVATGTEFDVLQDAGDVLLLEPGTVSVVDPASVTLTSQASLPGSAEVSLGDGTVAVTDPGNGAVWVRTMQTLGTLAVDGDVPDLDLGPGGGAVVTRDGVVLAVDSTGALRRATVDESGVAVSEAGTFDGAGPFEQVTAVGDRLVALSGRTLHTPGGRVDLSSFGEDLVLQQVGPDADTVLVASPTALLEVPLDGGSPREHVTGGQGTAAAPVRSGGCAMGAWASSVGSYAQVCDGRAEVTDLRGMSSTDTLVFRVNRDVVVLNDTLRGRVWVPQEDPDVREPNWEDIQPQDETEQDEDSSDGRESTQNVQAECSAESAAPSAADDDYGVRAGRTTILSVIDNDGSSECGILTISEHDDLPEQFGTLQPVYGGRALQLVVAPGASGTQSFTYTVSDGRGTTAPSTATVTLTVRPPTSNDAPEQVRVGSFVVEQGARATYDVLPDFRDPDGDDLILTSAVAESGGTVRTRQDGQLTFESDGGSLGRHQVRLIVSDGEESVEGRLTVDVRPSGSLPPVIDPVHVVTYAGEPLVVRPLESVRSLSREPVRLAGVDELAGTTIEPDLAAGTFTFTAARAGTYYVTFLVTASPQEATGLARIDVLDPPEQVPPPVAVRDRALLPPGGEVSIDPLANDADPAGGVLVLQSVDVPAATGLRVAVLNHQLLRIESLRVLDDPVTLTYTVSNGAASAVGEVLVQPIPASATQQPPVVPNVDASVRAGGVVTIPVLEGAYDPDGDPLTVEPTLAEPLGRGEGLLFVSGDVLRYQAPESPMEVHALFTVSDSAGNKTSAQVTVSVHASDADSKAPPRPKRLTARVFEGGTVRIPVPLVGIDPDGDGVSLLGPDETPAHGFISEVGPDWLEYTSDTGFLGTDTFTYAVEDWVGQRAVATVRVGIAARPTTAAEVVARNDDVTVRPGRSVEVRVLANDADTAGGDLALGPDLEMDPGVEASIQGRRIVVRAPQQEGVVNISYTATNDRGGRDSAVLTVTVSEDAPILPPIARDVVVPATETINRTSVEVDVLEVAQNPSGPLSDLEVSVDPSVRDVATVTPTGSVVVTLIDRPQTLPYLLTNTAPEADGVSSYAFITVPALGDFPPVLRPGAPALAVIAGDQLTIPLAEQVQVAPGREPVVLDAGSVRATRSDGSSLIKSSTTLLFRAERGYAGPASISFEVSDGKAGDATARTRVLTLPITVLAAEDHPPTFSPSVIDVSPGETVPVTVDLRVFTSAPVGTADGLVEYTYALVSTPPAAFDVRLDGSMLSVSAAASALKGTIGGVSLTIDYGGSEPVEVQVDFRVVASSRQVARVVDHVVTDGVEGQTSTVQALAGAFNPFPGQPLTVVGAVAETPGAGTVSVSGSTVSVRPDNGYIGPMVARYRVRDATGDPDREVEGRITVIVRGRPEAPTAPRVQEVRDRTVVLAWDAPASNGADITGYQVTAQPGGLTRDCASTTCTIEGLTNDTEYTFTVSARNAVGWSDQSPASQPARPDAVPGPPGTPVLVFGDGSVTARWAAPENTGSPVTSYSVEVSPSSASGASFTTTSTELRIDGLTNGTAYTVRVRAHNRAPDPGPWGQWSAPMVPARAPDAPTVTATRISNQLGGQIDVRWTPGAANGDAVIDWELVIANGPGGRTVSGISADARSYQFNDAANGVEYTFSVRARNKAGAGAAGTARASAYGVPFAPPGVTATASSTAAVNAGWVEVAWSAADGNGSPVTEYQVRTAGGSWTVPGTRRDLRIDGLTGGQAVAAEVSACSIAGCGPWSSAGSVTPLTVPAGPRDVTLQAPASTDGWPSSITGTWDTPSQWGGAGGQRYEYRIYRNGDGAPGWTETTGTSASLALPRSWFEDGGSAEIVLDVRARTDAGPGDVFGTTRSVSASAPGAVVNAVMEAISADRTTIRASWSAPAPNGGPAPDYYEVRFRQSSGGSWSGWTRTADASQLYLDLAVSAEIRDEGGWVEAQIRAHNGVGLGPTVQTDRQTVP